MTFVSLRRVLPDGLILRTADSTDDLERQIELMNRAFTQGESGLPLPEVDPWMRDLGSGHHPYTRIDHLYLVDDPATGRAVACTRLIPMDWAYGGIEFKVGRLEQVATHPDYRGRGLVKHLFDAIDERIANDGMMVQAINGIPNYYRQFGYEYALELDGGRRVRLDNVPSLPPGMNEHFCISPADAGDIPFMMRLYEEHRHRSLVSPTLSESYWRWMILQVNPDCGLGWLPLIITRGSDPNPVGYVLLRSRRRGTAVTVVALEVIDGVSLLDLRDPLLRAVAHLAPRIPPLPRVDPEDAGDISFIFGSEHPLYPVLTTMLRPTVDEPKAWYLRVNDLARFLKHIGPELERRLAASSIAGHSGTVTINLYRSWLVLDFDGGALRDVRREKRQPLGQPFDAGSPPLPLLQALFGRRTLAELHSTMPDVWVNPASEPVLSTLFPSAPSCVPPIY